MDFRIRPVACAAMSVALAAGCRTSAEAEGLQADVQVGVLAPLDPEVLVSHRFGEWLALAPEPSALAVLGRACELERAGAVEEGIAFLGDAIDEGPASASLLEARGALYVATGFPRAAAGDFQRAVALAPARGSGWYGLGHAYEVLGLSRQALEALERARGLGFEDAGVDLSLARVHRTLGRRGMAARCYELALERLAPAPLALLAEMTTLATEDATRAAEVAAQRERLESCRGVELTDDGWLLRALLAEMPGAPATEVAETFQALDAPQEELASLAASLLTACQLVDAATAEETRARVVAREPDTARRAALERCLIRQ